MRNIAIIPARSGSKGLKNKNIKDLNGKPLITYSIEAALESKLFDVVMVSTDSARYAKIAQEYGAEVPFLRSKMNASDRASSWDTVEEVLEKYENVGQNFDTFCLLQPTSPLRSASDLVQAYKLYVEKRAMAIVSVCEMEHPIYWSGTLDKTQSIAGFIKRENMEQRQKQKQQYRINGAIYLAEVKEFRKDHFFFREGGYAYIMPKERSVDIDTEIDFKYAEFLMKNSCFGS